MNQAIEGNKEVYYMYMLKARIQKEMGDKTGAKTTVEKTVQLATTAQNYDYVKQENDLIK